MAVVMGDLNAKVRNEQDPLLEVVGRHGLGSCNERGDIWIDSCTTPDQVITNTWFQHHNRQLYTWKSPGDGARNQIYYITINNRFRNSIIQVKGYPGAVGGSDHVPIVATLRLKLQKRHTNKSANKLQVQLHSTDAHWNQYQQCINQELNNIDTIDQLEDCYDIFVGILSTSAQATLPKREARAKQNWMTSDILQMMERRRLTNSNVDEYNKIDAEIRRECQTAKEKMLTAQCDKIEQTDAAHKSNQVHARIRQNTGRKQSACVTTCIEEKMAV